MTEHLIVDALNLIHGAARILGAGESGVKRLVCSLESYASLHGRRLTLVFDGTRFEGEIASSKGMTVIFSDPGQKADEVIERLMSALPEGERLASVLVSDDRALRSMAVGLGLRTKGVEEMLGDVKRELSKESKARETGSRKPFNNPFSGL